MKKIKLEAFPHDTCRLSDGTKFRILGNRVLVRADKPRELSKNGLIQFPNGAMEQVNTTGTILAYGTVNTKKGECPPIEGIEVGEKVVFIRFLADQHSSKAMQARLEDGVFSIAPSDIILIYTPDEEDKILW